MAFCPEYISTLSHFDLERYKLKVQLIGCDPYEIAVQDCSDSLDLWPNITDVDRIDYLVNRTNFVSKDSMKNLKSCESHNFFTSGHVFRPKVKKLSGHVLVLGEVMHSQCVSSKPLKCWLYVKDDGEIVTAHCNCMAGRGETCSHIGAIIFLLEYAAKAKDSESCTDKINQWLRPCLKSAISKRVADMVIESPASKLIKLLDSPDVPTASTHQYGQCSDVQKDSVRTVLKALEAENERLFVLSTFQEHSGPFISPTVSQELPKLMADLYDPNAEGMDYEDLLLKCEVVIKDVCGDKGDVRRVEEITRKQSLNDLWFRFRKGRITASSVGLVMSGNIKKPAPTTYNAVCYGRKQFFSAATDRGLKLEAEARRKYLAVERVNHENLSVKECGLFISEKHPFLAASSDGVIQCDCCEGTGGLEIKCPDLKNMEKCFDSEGRLLRNHSYFYQVQTQMFVCEFSYCDFFLYYEKRNILHRVLPDKDCHQVIVQKCRDYFLYVILPELIAKHFTLTRSPLVPLALANNRDDTICYCRTPKRDPIVKCSGVNCTFVEFHCRCVDLVNPPKKQWYCDQCKEKN